jgi:hypothetical protein
MPSGATGARRDVAAGGSAIKGLIDDAAALASRILSERRDKLVEIAEHLTVVETIDADEFSRLIGPDWQTIDEKATQVLVSA